MHQNLNSLQKSLNVTASDLCSFSEGTEASIHLRVGSVSYKDPHAIQFHLDEIDSAVAEVSQFRNEASYTMAEVQYRMREIQRKYVGPDVKPTVAERLYKADEEHSALEAALTKLKAACTYAETLENLLRNKYFELKSKSKLG